MPAKSKAHNRLMQGVAHSKEFAKKVGISQNVGKEFAESEHGKSLAKLPERKKK